MSDKKKVKNVPLPLNVPEHLKEKIVKFADDNRRSTNAQAIVIFEKFFSDADQKTTQQKKG